MLPKLAVALHTTVDALPGYGSAATDYDSRYISQEYYWGLAPNRLCYAVMQLLPPGCRLAQKLPQPVLTPAPKTDTGHDTYIPMEQVTGCLGTALTAQIIQVCLQLYQVCSAYACTRGLLIADAKFEFGLNAQGELVLADEIFTPDASRYWAAEDWQAGLPPRAFDKQLLWDWLLEHRENGAFLYDRVPAQILQQTAQRYRECLYRLTGQTL